MPGFAKAGTVITSGSNLAIAGQKPAGLAAQGQVIWSAAVGSWQLVTTATIASPGPSNQILNSSAVDTTGANLLVWMLFHSTAAASFSDNVGNMATLAVSQLNTITYKVSIYYTLNPNTSASHVFTLSYMPYSSILVLAFKGAPNIHFDQSNSSLLNDATTTLQLPAITPSADESLVISAITMAGVATGIDSGFENMIVLPGVSGQLYGGSAAFLRQHTASAVSPTWTMTDTSSAGAVAAMANFIPSPWQLLASTQFAAPVGTSAAIDTTEANLLIAYITSSGDPVFSDSQNNVWLQGAAISNSATISILYCINPITSTSHTFVTTPSAAATIVHAFKGPSRIALDQVVSNTSSNLLTLQMSPLTPSANSSLVVMTAGGTASVTSISSPFIIANNIAFVNTVNYSGAAAYYLQSAASALAPTWTFPYAVGTYSAAVMLSFTGA